MEESALSNMSVTSNILSEYPVAKKLVILENRNLLGDVLKTHIAGESLFREVVFALKPDDIAKFVVENEPAVFLVSGNYYPELIDAISDIHKNHTQAYVVVLDEHVRHGVLMLVRDARIHGYWTCHDSIPHFLFGLREAFWGRESASPLITKYVERDQNGLKLSRLITGHPLLILTRRELELFLKIGEGKPPQICSREMGIALRTVVNLREKLMRKLKLQTHVEILWKAMEYGLIRFSQTQKFPNL